jgi:hypothetical protein
MNELQFVSRDDLNSQIRKHYRQKGVVLAVRRSDSNFVRYECDHSGKHQAKLAPHVPDANRRRVSTIKCNCPFYLCGVD